jgi:hypothetical protein
VVELQEEAMTRTPISLALGVILLFPVALPAQPAQPSVEELRRQVEQKEQELNDAQAALASARARLAKAEGKTELAAAEGRKVVAHAEGRLKALLDLYARGRGPCTDEALREAQGAIAIARVWVADVEGKRDDLLAELPKVIAYYERRVQRYETLRAVGAVSEQEAREAVKADESELKQARDRLAALRDAPATRDKGGKP